MTPSREVPPERAPDPVSPDGLLRSAARKTDDMTSSWQALMLVLIGRLRERELPAELTDVVDIAARYWDDRSRDSQVLMEAKRRSWNYLGEHEPDALSTVRGRSVRALLCVLEPDGDPEAESTTAEWFSQMLSHESRGQDQRSSAE